MPVYEDTAAVTGHRPHKLAIGNYSGYDENNPLRVWIRVQLHMRLQEHQIRRGITGMAPGVDQDFARVCIETKIPFIAAVPFIGQDRTWPAETRKRYRQLLDAAAEVVVVCTGGYERWKLQARNEWMVEHGTHLFAVFDGSPGGTANTVAYADRFGPDKNRDRINPDDFRREWLNKEALI